MANRTGRKINLIDVMILIAATGLGIAAGRAQLSANKTPGAWWAVDAQLGSVWFTVIWSSALIVVQLRGGRPDRRRLSCRPGFTACVGTVATLVMMLVLLLTEKLVFWGKMGRAFRFDSADVYQRLFPLLTLITPGTVAATWAVQVVGGRWRPARDWIDRLGIVVGLYWVTWNVVANLLMLGL